MPRPFDLLVWAEPKDLDDQQAPALITKWLDAGMDPASSPFEPSTDMGWFYRELMQNEPQVVAITDAKPTTTTKPVGLSGGDDGEPPARVVAIRLVDETVASIVDTVFGRAIKYDLMVFEAHRGRVMRPHGEMSDYASATFWPAGAIRTIVAGLLGLGLAIGGWILGIPIVGWLLILIGGFLFILCLSVLAGETRTRLRPEQQK